MRSRVIGRTLGSLLGVHLAACGSSGSGSGSGSAAGPDSGANTGINDSVVGGEAGAPCDSAPSGDTGRRCLLSMPVQGGLTGVLDAAAGCGDGSGTSMGASLAWTSSSPAVRVSAYFQGGLPQQPGTYPLSSLTIRSAGADGGAQSWTAPAGACSIVVNIVDVECQSIFGKLMTIVQGTGTCTQPAAPDPGTSAGPVMISSFPFEHWL